MSQHDRFLQPLGVQLYTVRDVLPRRPDLTLKRIQDIGYSEVECQRADLAMLAPFLKKYGLSVPSVHIETGLIAGRRAEWKLPDDLTLDAAFEQLRAHGADYAAIPYVFPDERATLDDWRSFCDKLNHAGEAARRAGLTLCYHHHAFEWAGEPGQRRMDLLLEHTDASLLHLEVDVFWLATAGQNPVEFIERHAGRVRLIHLKDRAVSAHQLFDEAKVKRTDFREIGSGSLDFPAILRAARKAGVAHYFVEQDYTPHDPVRSLRASYQRLRALTL